MSRTQVREPAPEEPLHVVHVISGLGLGGAETVLLRLVMAPGQNVKHTVVSMGDDGVLGARLREAGIPLHTLGMYGIGGMARGLVDLYRLLRRSDVDVVQTWMYHADLVAGAVARLAGIKAVSWGIRNSGANLSQASRSSRITAWLCARVSGLVPSVIVTCAENAAARHRQWGYRADRMLVIPNGYDLSRWQPDPQARARLRGEWGLAQDTPVIGSVGRWNPLKDHANLLAAMALSLQRYPALRCVLAGQGLTADNSDLMSLINQSGLRDKVMLLGVRDDIPQVMNALDVHVLSSLAEGFPNVVAEAMAAGTPCVVTDVGDAARIVGAEGWVAPARDAAALSQAIDAALATLGSPELAARIVHGRERVARLYSLQTMVDNYEVVWRRLATDYPRQRSRPRGDAPSVDPRLYQPWTPPAQGYVAQPRRLLFVVNNPAFFLSHRLPLAQGAQHAGFEVHVATMDGRAVAEINAHGLTHHIIPMSRSGKHPIEELRTIYALWRLFRDLRPNLVHAVTIKPVLYGGIAARLAAVPAYVAAISGLGFIFTRASARFDPLRWAATALYRLALGHGNSRVIFQNENDRDVLRRAGVVRAEQVVMIRGSGVDLNKFQASPEPEESPVAMMASRLLIDKGVSEFVEAARMTQGHASGLRWRLAGSLDPGNPASVTAEQLALWQKEGVVEFLGEQSDIAALYRQSHMVVLPSYREGLPKSLVEAAACGRAVVTTDVPGCRDAIEPGVTGLLVPARDARALADAAIRLANDPYVRKNMGLAGRRLAEREFDIARIVQAHLDLYRQLLV